jgi:hypothetical protein
LKFMVVGGSTTKTFGVSDCTASAGRRQAEAMVAPTPPAPSLRQQLVVLFCVLHAVAVGLVACPSPVRGQARADYAKPQVQGELRAWTTRFAMVGIEMSTEQFTDHLMALAKHWMDLRSTVYAPMLAYLKRIGSTQGWYMFTGPDTEPSTFVVEGLRGNAKASDENRWELLAGSTEEGLWRNHPLLDHRARRHIFMASWGDSKKTVKAMCAGLADLAIADLPDVHTVRCRFHKHRIVTPAEHRAGVLTPRVLARQAMFTRSERTQTRLQAAAAVVVPEAEAP